MNLSVIFSWNNISSPRMRQSIDSGIRDRFKDELSYLLSCIGTKFPRREANRYEQRMMLTMDDPADYFIKMSTLIMSVRKKLPDPNEPARTSYDYGHDAFMLTVLEYFGKRFEFLKRSNLGLEMLIYSSKIVFSRWKVSRQASRSRYRA